MNRVRFALAVTTLAAASCATVTPEMQRVRVTNNPEVVRGCKFLGNTSPSRDTQWRSGSWDNDSVFREHVIKMGGNVGYITAQPQKPTEGIGYYGEVYLCEPSAAAVASRPAAENFLNRDGPSLHWRSPLSRQPLDGPP